ncbi:MAG TPA: helix-turn-helix domain-containing protein [Sphingomonadaceae bacterium]|nr:helix-turn-helix domain-containing protein [Sphingomonadaceae bacterium]
MTDEGNPQASKLADEAARVRASGALGESGRLVELFDYLAARGPDREPASQAEIAHAVFGQQDAEGDDATVRVYIHRLRKRLDEYYEDPANAGSGIRLAIPPGSYALRLAALEKLVEPVAAMPRRPTGRAWLAGLAAILLVAAFALGWFSRNAAPQTAVNAIWQPFLESERPIMVVAGDYYIFGEYAPDFPEIDRLVRDFAINSPTDLARAQEADPLNYERSEDLGLNYLPFSSAYGLGQLMPILERGGHEVSIMPASAFTSDTFRTHNVVYVGLMSGMGLLEDVNFTGSNYAIGANYDELIDGESRRRYMSEEALSLASARYYKDYGYFASFREPGGALVAVVAGARDTGLRGLAPLVSEPELAQEVERLAESGEGFEALYEITGQQGADLSERLVAARKRP